LRRRLRVDGAADEVAEQNIELTADGDDRADPWTRIGLDASRKLLARGFRAAVGFTIRIR
jgi:hypothetical protein